MKGINNAGDFLRAVLLQQTQAVAIRSLQVDMEVFIISDMKN